MDFTAAAKDNTVLRAVDAPDASLPSVELQAVGATEVSWLRAVADRGGGDRSAQEEVGLVRVGVISTACGSGTSSVTVPDTNDTGIRFNKLGGDDTINTAIEVFRKNMEYLATIQRQSK